MKRLLLACIAFLPATAFAVEPLNLRDVPTTDPQRAPIQYLNEHDVIYGFLDGTFEPDRRVTRGEFLKMAYEGRGMGYTVLTSTAPATKTFSDVPATHTLAPYIHDAARSGFLSGYPDGTFKPDAPVTRAEASKIAVNVYGACTGTAVSPYKDTATTTLRPYIDRVYELNWFRPNGIEFLPDQPLLRRGTAQLIYRAMLNDLAAGPERECLTSGYTSALPVPAHAASDWQEGNDGRIRTAVPPGWTFKYSYATGSDTAMQVGIDPTLDMRTKHTSEAIIFLDIAPKAPHSTLEKVRELPGYTLNRVYAGDGAFMDLHEFYTVPNGDRALLWYQGDLVYTVIYHEPRMPGLRGIFYRFAQHAAAANRE